MIDTKSKIIDLYTLNLDWKSPLYREVDRYLSLDEIQKSEAFINLADAHRYRMTRGFLRKVIAGYLDIPPKEIVFKYNQWGKPEIIAEPFNFNVSHTDNKAIVAIGREIPIGVDIEASPSTIDIDEIVRSNFSVEENKMFFQASSEEKTDLFLRAFTRKEAILKALGTGLNDLSSELHVGVHAYQGVHQIEYLGKVFSLIDLRPDGAIGCVAIDAKLDFSIQFKS